MTNEYVIPLPAVDEWGTPVSKMPNCPHCGEDELGMMLGQHGDHDGFALCYRCQAIVIRHDKTQSLPDILLRCGDCPWMGSLGATEPGDEGELLCPQCLNEISVKTPDPV
jgi:hypothetical protein